MTLFTVRLKKIGSNFLGDIMGIYHCVRVIDICNTVLLLIILSWILAIIIDNMFKQF